MTETPAFTRGPWEAAERGGYSDFDGNSRVILGDDMRLAVVHTNGRPETEANAHLIAAAPELYEALDNLLRLFPVTVKGPAVDAIIDDAGNALLKARGEA